MPDAGVVPDFIRRALEQLPVMGYDEAQTVLRDLYETEFGIYNHLAKDKNPLSSVLHHKSEEVWLTSGLRELVEEFAVYNLGELFNITLKEFLTLPRPYVSMIREIKDSVLKKRDSIVTAVERDIFKESKNK